MFDNSFAYFTPVKDSISELRRARIYSYAGLHCVVIKGYSKSAGYQPGVCFEDNRFRNSWNAVYVAGAWRFVQCNWGARHLVNAKEVPRPGQAKAKNDSLRYDGSPLPPPKIRRDPFCDYSVSCSPRDK